ncbi:DMT family transporter [Rhizobium sp. ARZ01]|uniref:DMT family transporter n=1 Tax=Rhizobium sp. ARZ01 TaxID=2769313 RepID=UPI00177BD5FA|nr:DMT family transporter [Rhizobium sp. ARZ01]MBD9373384.1 DMT family transporter [Rhizobium sp. ARZ01]
MASNLGGRHHVGIALAFVCLLLLGVMPVISNGRPPGSGALVFALWLSIWQLLFSLPLLIREWRGGERGLMSATLSRARRNRILWITLFTGALFGISTWAYVLAFEKVGATNAALALQAYPLCAATLEAVFLGRRKGLAEVGFTGLLLIALYYLSTDGTWRPAGLSPWFGVAFAVPAIWSIAHVILRETLVSTPITPNQVTTSRLIVSTFVLAVLALTFEEPGEVWRTGLSPVFQAFALLMGLAYYLELAIWFNAMKHIDVSVASTITVPAPAITMIFAALFLGDAIQGTQIAAFGMIVIGLFGLLRYARPALQQPP